MSAWPAPFRTADMSSTFRSSTTITGKRMRIEDGHALAPEDPGIGIDWDWDAVKARSIAEFTTAITA